MFQYFPDEDVAVASADHQLFFLSRNDHPHFGTFQAVSPRGEDRTQDAVDLGLRSTFLAAAESAQVECLLQTMDRDLFYDPDSSGLFSALTLMGGDMDEDELLDERERMNDAGLLGSAESLYDDLCAEEFLLSAVGPAELTDQIPVWIDPAIPDEEKMSFADWVVRYRLSVIENPLATDETYSMLFQQPELAAWLRTLRSIHHSPPAGSIRRIRISAKTVPEYGVLDDEHSLLLGWQDVCDAATQCLGPAGYASYQEYDAVSRAIDEDYAYHADLAERAIGHAGKKLY